jgi:hypothetical protein
MALLDWTLVAFGAAIAVAGGWIQLHPQRLYPQQSRGWQPDPNALAQIRLLGGCFLFMGVFFALQMTADLARLPWWTGTLSGLAMSVLAMKLVNAWVRRQRRRRGSIEQPSLPKKILELR